MPQIPLGWKETTLGNIWRIITGKTPSTKDDSFWWWWTPFITPTDISNSSRYCTTERTLTQKATNQLRSLILPKNSICYTSIASIGLLCLTQEESLTNQQINSIIVNDDNNYSFYYYYLIYITPFLKKIAWWTTTNIINKSQFEKIPIICPPLPEQQAIAAVLSSFDDKIELLRAENQILEQMGQELFKERFGKWKVGDELPEGWRVGKLGEIAEITSWKRPSEISDTRNSLFEIPLIWATKIMGYVQNFLFDGETLVIGRVWTHWEVQIFYEKIHPSDNTLVIKSNNFYFTYFILKSIDYEKINRGAVQPLITQSDLKNYLVILPDQETLSKFDLVIKLLFNKIRANSEQIQPLSATRDQLLPKLMSGEVRVEF